MVIVIKNIYQLSALTLQLTFNILVWGKLPFQTVYWVFAVSDFLEQFWSSATNDLYYPKPASWMLQQWTFSLLA